MRFFDIGTLVQADRQEESSNVPGYAFRGLTMSKLVTDRRAISSKTYPGTARLDMETSPGLLKQNRHTVKDYLKYNAHSILSCGMIV